MKFTVMRVSPMQITLFSFTKVTFTSALLEATAHVSQCEVVMKGKRHTIGWRICLDHSIYSFMLVMVQFNDL